MKVEIRKEEKTDHQGVFELIEKAFENELYSDHREQFLVEKLRKASTFIPELSIVALYNGLLAGYILLTPIQIVNQKKSFSSLALAPVAVWPDYQNKGIGQMLILNAHQTAIETGFQSIVLLGHADYYPKFGYRPAHQFGIHLPFDVPLENCMAIELVKDGLKGVSGMVEYPIAFNNY